MHTPVLSSVPWPLPQAALRWLFVGSRSICMHHVFQCLGKSKCVLVRHTSPCSAGRLPKELGASLMQLLVSLRRDTRAARSVIHCGFGSRALTGDLTTRSMLFFCSRARAGLIQLDSSSGSWIMTSFYHVKPGLEENVKQIHPVPQHLQLPSACGTR